MPERHVVTHRIVVDLLEEVEQVGVRLVRELFITQQMADPCHLHLLNEEVTLQLGIVHIPGGRGHTGRQTSLPRQTAHCRADA